MITRFDPAKVYIQDSTSPWVSYEGLGRIGIWWFDKQALCLDYTFKLMGSVENTEIPCRKSEIVEVLRKIADQAYERYLKSSI